MAPDAGLFGGGELLGQIRGELMLHVRKVSTAAGGGADCALIVAPDATVLMAVSRRTCDVPLMPAGSGRPGRP